MLNSARFPIPNSMKNNFAPTMLAIGALGVAIPLLGPLLGIFLFLFIAGLVVFVVGVAFLAFVLWLIARRFWPGNENEKQAVKTQSQDKPDGGK